MNNNIFKNFSPLLKSTLLAYSITIISLVILSELVYKFNLSESIAYTGINIVYILSCFISGFVIGRMKQEKKYLWGFLNGFCYFLCLITISFLVQHSISDNISSILPIALYCCISSTIGGMLS